MPLELKNSKCRAVIYPEYGGLLNHFFVKKEGTEVDVIRGYTSTEELKEKLSEDFRGIKLSPYPNRIKGGKYSFKGQECQLELNFKQEGNSIHGFLFDQVFEIKSQTDKSIIISYEISKTDFSGYPFSYKIEMEYTLLDRGLLCKTILLNTDKDTIPIADGFHPYFKIGDQIGEVRLKLPATKKLILKEGIPTGEKEEHNLFLTEELVKDHSLDDCFEITAKDEVAETILKKEDLSIIIKQQIGDSKYNFLQVYTPPSRDCIALEPMTSAPNCFNNKLGLIELKEEQSLEMAYQFTVELGR